MLKNYGYCHEAASNEEAVTLFRQGLAEEPYDVVFLEVALQRSGGWSTLQAIRQMEEECEITEFERVKCIMISTVTQKRCDTSATEYTGQWDGYLIKPIAPDLLERELQRLKLTGPKIEIFNARQLATLIVDVGDKEIVRELVVKFMVEFPNKIIEMKKELMAEEYSHIQKMAHELVSISGTYGFRGLSEILRTIEQAAIRSDKKIMGDGIGLAVKQWQEIQGPLADFMADCGVHDGE